MKFIKIARAMNGYIIETVDVAGFPMFYVYQTWEDAQADLMELLDVV